MAAVAEALITQFPRRRGLGFYCVSAPSKLLDMLRKEAAARAGEMFKLRLDLAVQELWELPRRFAGTFERALGAASAESSYPRRLMTGIAPFDEPHLFRRQELAPFRKLARIDVGIGGDGRIIHACRHRPRRRKPHHLVRLRFLTQMCENSPHGPVQNAMAISSNFTSMTSGWRSGQLCIDCNVQAV